MQKGLFIITLTALGLMATSCVPLEDTTPSSALFPASTSNGATIRPDFSKQLNQNAPRQEVELHALYGAFYADRKLTENRPVFESLDKGYFKDAQNGKRIYRVKTVSEAQKILGNSWKSEKWAASSDLGKRFQMSAYTSIAVLNGKDQRILFFDQSERLVGVYPKAS